MSRGGIDLPTRWLGERPWRTAPQHAPHKVLCGHGLCEQGALRQAEAQLTRGKKVGPVLHPIGHGACAHRIGEIDDSPAGRLFAAIVRTAGDELSSDLEFGEGKTVKPRKRRPLGSEISVRSEVPRARARRRAIEHDRWRSSMTTGADVLNRGALFHPRVSLGYCRLDDRLPQLALVRQKPVIVKPQPLLERCRG